VEAEREVAYHARVLLEMAEGRRVTWVIDPAASQRTAASAKSVMAQFAEYGLWTRPAINARWAGIERVRDFLRLRDDGFPRLYVFETCPRLIEGLKRYRWSDTRPDEPHKMDDDEVDALRYAVMAMPRAWRYGDGRDDHTAAPEGDEPTSYRRVVRSKAAGY
jgi:hypothetical protein